MRVREAIGTAGALTVAAGLTVAISAGPEKSQAEAPNNTIEQVERVLGQSALDSLGVQQQFSFDVASGQRVNVYNFTKTPIGENTTERAATFIYDQASTQTEPFPITLYKDAQGHQPYSASVRLYPRQTKERDILLVPASMPMPELISKSDFTSPLLPGVTRYINHDQTISIIRQPLLDGYPDNWFDDTQTGTELYQSLVEASTGSKPIAMHVGAAQEPYSNSMGEAIFRASRGTDYSTYAGFERDAGTVSVSVDGHEEQRYVKDFTVDEAAFNAMQNALGASTNHPVN